MQPEGVSKKTKHSLEILSKIEKINQFYLAGGTAVALYLGHRLSFDLDFFTSESFSSDEIIAEMNQTGKFKLEQKQKDTLLGFFEGTQVSFFKYQYPLISETTNFLNVKIAAKKDLMAMKIDAISSRGTKRDFIDLYFLSQEYSLKKAVEAYKQKYSGTDINLFHSLKSLTYFIDAENSKMPEMLKDCSWEEVKKYFLEETAETLESK